MACVGEENNRVNGGGSTFVYPAMTKWAAEYNKAKNVQLNYESIGSGAGILRLATKDNNFACTDVPMNDEQIKKCKEAGGEIIHVPLVLRAVVPVYNLPDVKEPLRFTGPVLADIYLGKITKWNDKALKAINPDAKLPDTEIIPLHRSDGSGTTYVWTDYLAKVSSDWKEKVGVGTTVNWPTGIGFKGSGFSAEVRRVRGTLGYVELPEALSNKLTVGVVKNRDGSFIKPTSKCVMAAADAALKDFPDDLRFSLTNAPGKESYPICGATWAVVYAHQPKDRGGQVTDFLRWVIGDGQKFCEGLDYVRLPKNLVKRVEKKVEQIKTD
jgi:phosphate transport system substrate-binding protein